jgi:hypothetical protein
MKRYDKIYVPCDENESALFAAWGEEAADYVGAIQEKENVIVLTIEELNEVFRAGHRYADWRYDKGEFADISSPEPPPKFNEYLTPKGITL